jgi:chemotaxis protein methyltransferase CheR
MVNINNEEFTMLTNYIKSNYGINLMQKKNLIEGRLSNTIIEKGFTNFKDYLNFVFSDTSKSELTALINKLTTNHTFFMREANHFEYFKTTVLPYLESTVRDRDLRVWSAGCSSGEEPYTLAMIMEDYFGSVNANTNTHFDKKVLATDISVHVLEEAEKGIYSTESMGELPKTWKSTYFNKIENNNYIVSDELKKEVIFRIFNLMDEVYPFKKKFHVIFCRNVMIYFDLKTKIELVNKLYDMTEKGGYLFIGHSESITREETKYKYIMPAVYRKG